MCPTITVGSFFLDTKGPLFCSFVQQPQTSTTSNLNNSNLRSASKTKRKKQNRRPQPRKHILAPLFFSTFFEVFWIAPEGPPFICLDILQHNGCQKIAKGPPFYIFRHCDTVQKSHSKNFFGKFFHVSKGSPLRFFSNFLQPAGVSQSPKGPPF